MIEIHPSISAWGENPDDFCALAAGLREEGLEVKLVEPPPPDPNWNVQAAGMDFVINVLDDAKHEIISTIVGMLILKVGQARKDRREKRRRVYGVIYGPNGEELRQVSVDHKKDHGPS